MKRMIFGVVTFGALAALALPAQAASRRVQIQWTPIQPQTYRTAKIEYCRPARARAVRCFVLASIARNTGRVTLTIPAEMTLTGGAVRVWPRQADKRLTAMTTRHGGTLRLLGLIAGAQTEVSVNESGGGNTDTPPPSGGPSESGIEGTIFAGPVCPVETYPPQENCAPRPLDTTIVVKSTDGSREIARFTTGIDGRFRVVLSPGTYLLTQPPSAEGIAPIRFPSFAPLTVTVTAGQFTTLRLDFDTGIR